MAKNLKTTQARGVTGSSQTQRGTMSLLGLKKTRQFVTYPDNLVVCDRVCKVCHLVTVEEIDQSWL